MEFLTREHGVNSFKMFMAYDFMLNDGDLYSAFEYCEKLGCIAQVHAENGSVISKNAEKLIAKGVTGPEGHEQSRPEEIEAEAVNRACVIAKQVSFVYASMVFNWELLLVFVHLTLIYTFVCDFILHKYCTHYTCILATILEHYLAF